MEIFLSISSIIPTKINFSPLYWLFSIFLIILSYLYLHPKSNINKIKKRTFENLFKLPSSLEKEMNDFKGKPTKLYFHFIRHFSSKQCYKSIYLPSQKQFFNIKGNDLVINYIDKKYTFKYYVAEKIILMDSNGIKKTFIIVVNKHVENYYNIIIDMDENIKKTYSLEIITYAKTKKDLNKIEKLKNLEIYKKETHLQNILRCNIINAREEDLSDIYSINLENEKNAKIDEINFTELKENLLLNIIISEDGKIALRRIFENIEENIIFRLQKYEINLLKDLYSEVIKKYINTNSDDGKNINNFKDEFLKFDMKHGYKEKIDEDGEKSIDSDLRIINLKFRCTPFFIWVYDKDNISLEELKITEYLCFLNLILFDKNQFLEKIQDFIEQKNLIFDKYSYLSNKDKSLILINLLTNAKKDKSNYQFISYYDIPTQCSYIQSELFFRKAVSELNDNSSLTFLYLQLNSGGGEDYITKKQYYKIRMIPLIEIKYHLLKKFFYPYFFSYDSNNGILALNNINTQIISFNESKECGYSKPIKLSKLYSQNNMIKLAFLKFHENAHIKFNSNYDDNLDPRFLLDDKFGLIDNKNKKKNNLEKDSDLLDAGESGNALEFFLFNDFTALDKLMATTENLNELNNTNLLTQDNFGELRRIINELTKDVELTIPYDKINELSKKYKEKVKKSKKFKNKKISEIKLSDLEIEELY